MPRWGDAALLLDNEAPQFPSCPLAANCVCWEGVLKGVEGSKLGCQENARVAAVSELVWSSTKLPPPLEVGGERSQ